MLPQLPPPTPARPPACHPSAVLAGDRGTKAAELEVQVRQLKASAASLERQAAAAVQQAEEEYMVADRKQAKLRELEHRIQQLRVEVRAWRLLCGVLYDAGLVDWELCAQWDLFVFSGGSCCSGHETAWWCEGMLHLQLLPMPCPRVFSRGPMPSARTSRPPGQS